MPRPWCRSVLPCTGALVRLRGGGTGAEVGHGRGYCTRVMRVCFPSDECPSFLRNRKKAGVTVGTGPLKMEPPRPRRASPGPPTPGHLDTWTSAEALRAGLRLGGAFSPGRLWLLAPPGPMPLPPSRRPDAPSAIPQARCPSASRYYVRRSHNGDRLSDTQTPI